MTKKACRFFAVSMAEVAIGYANPFAAEGVETAVSLELYTLGLGWGLELYLRPIDAKALAAGARCTTSAIRMRDGKSDEVTLEVLDDGNVIRVVVEGGTVTTTFNLRSCGLNLITALLEPCLYGCLTASPKVGYSGPSCQTRLSPRASRHGASPALHRNSAFSIGDLEGRR